MDWTGDKNSVFKTLGASNHCSSEREVNDYYATDPNALEQLLRYEKFNPYVWECACGAGHLSNVLKNHGYKVMSSDIINRGYDDMQIVDFLSYKPVNSRNDFDIITNPPYKYALDFVKHALEISMESVKVAMLLRIQFLEGQKRYEFFKENPPKIVYVFSKRVQCAKNGLFIGSSAVCYAWFIWENGWYGNPIIKWL